MAGKGGSGKTTVAATLARLAARRGRQVVAIDGDSSPNLAVALGVPRDAAAALAPVPRDILQDRTDAEGRKTSVLAVPPAEVFARYAADAPDGVRVLVMGRVGHAGAG